MNKEINKKNQLEQEFLEIIVDYYETGFRLAELCEKSTHKGLKDMCKEFGDSVDDELAIITIWLMDWYGYDHNPDIPQKYKNKIMELMNTSGENFEKLYLKAQADYFKDFLSIINDLCLEDFHQELVDYCFSLPDKKGPQIDQLNKWLKDWYKID